MPTPSLLLPKEFGKHLGWDFTIRNGEHIGRHTHIQIHNTNVEVSAKSPPHLLCGKFIFWHYFSWYLLIRFTVQICRWKGGNPHSWPLKEHTTMIRLWNWQIYQLNTCLTMALTSFLQPKKYFFKKSNFYLMSKEYLDFKAKLSKILFSFALPKSTFVPGRDNHGEPGNQVPTKS